MCIVLQRNSIHLCVSTIELYSANSDEMPINIEASDSSLQCLKGMA